MKYNCPVCNCSMDEPPSDWNYCPCCGTQFNYHDVGRTYEELRAEWVAGGKQWWSPVRNPKSETGSVLARKSFAKANLLSKKKGEHTK